MHPALERAQFVYRLDDYIQSGKALIEHPSDNEWWLQAKECLERSKLELLWRLSEKPGEEYDLRYSGAAPYQIEIWEAAREGCKRLAVGGANRSAKTVAIGGAFCEFLRDRARDGYICWLIAQDWDMMRAVPQKLLWDILPRSMFPKGTKWTAKLGLGQHEAMTLSRPGGGEIHLHFKNEQMELNKFESDKVAACWWSEASRESIYDAMATRLTDTQGPLWMDYLPKYGWLKYRVRQNKAFKVWRVGMKHNAHNLPTGAIQSAIDDLHGQESEIRVRVFGEEASAFGSVYPQFNPTRHSCKRFQLPKEAKHAMYRCYDYGFRHASVCLWCSLLPMGFEFPEGVGSCWDGKELDREVLLIYREYYVKGRTVPIQAADILALSEGESYGLGGLMVSDPSLFAIDQTGMTEPKSRADIFRECGLTLKKGKKATGPNGHALVSRVRRWFEEDKIIMFDDCEHCIQDHESWRHKENKDGVAPGPEPYEDKNNDCCLRGDTRILTPGGWRRIDQLAGHEGFIYTPFGWEWYDICAKTYNDAEVWELKLSNGKSLFATSDHKIQTVSGWKTVDDIACGDFLYESSGNIGNDTTIQRRALLLGREVFHQSQERSHKEPEISDVTSRGVGVSQRFNSTQNAHAPCQLQEGRQPDRQSDGYERVGALPVTHDPGAEKEGDGQLAKVCDSCVQGVAQKQGGSLGPQPHSEADVGETNPHNQKLYGLHEGIRDVEMHGQEERVLLPEMQRCGQISKKKGLQVLNKAVVGCFPVYDLTVPSVHCFFTDSGVVVSNCDALKELLAENITYNDPPLRIIDSTPAYGDYSEEYQYAS